MSKDILFIISDQHSYKVQGNAGNTIIKTPNLDRLAKDGTVMRDCYAACPLCVPSRLSMLSGQYPSKIHAMDNQAVLDSGIATFVHALNAGGYDTTLCGRMHFIGPDQRHGFTKRLVGDITPTIFGNEWKNRKGADGLPWNRGRIEQVAIQCMGGGDSTVLEFDRDVTEAAISYLKEEYERPQFLCVGMYAPHFPYIAPKRLFDDYYERVRLPEESYDAQEHPVLEGKLRDIDPETVRAAMAAYYGMIEFMDQNIGKIVSAWEQYLKRTGREGIVIYVSDHGDSNGEHGFYGKNTFFDPAVHVPMIFQGTGILKGKEILSPVSLLDLSPTICDMAEVERPPVQDGISLIEEISGEKMRIGESDGNADLDERVVISELSNRFGAKSIGRMAKWKQYKYVTFSGFEQADQLFDLKADPFERDNIIQEHSEIVQKLAGRVKQTMIPAETVIKDLELEKANMEIITKCRQESREHWSVRAGMAEEAPVPMISTKVEISWGNVKKTADK